MAAITSDNSLDNMRQKIRNAQVKFENGYIQTYPLSVLTANSLLRDDEMGDSNFLPNPDNALSDASYPRTAYDALEFHDTYIKHLQSDTSILKNDVDDNTKEINMLGLMYEDLSDNIDFVANQSMFALNGVEYDNEALYLNSITDEVTQSVYSNGSFHTYVIQEDNYESEELSKEMFSYGKAISLNINGKINSDSDTYNFVIGNTPKTTRYIEDSIEVFRCTVVEDEENNTMTLSDAEWEDCPCEDASYENNTLTFTLPVINNSLVTVEELDEDDNIIEGVEEAMSDAIGTSFSTRSSVTYVLYFNEEEFALKPINPDKLIFEGNFDKNVTVEMVGKEGERKMVISYSANFLGINTLSKISIKKVEKNLIRNAPLEFKVVKYINLNLDYVAKITLSFYEEEITKNNDVLRNNYFLISDVRDRSGAPAALKDVGEICISETFLVN